MKTVWHLIWTCKIWKAIYHSLHGRWLLTNIVQDDRTTHVQGFSKLQNEQQGKEDTIETVCHDNTRYKRDTLCMLYAKAAKRQEKNFQDYCRHVCTLNKDQCHIVMYNRAWCKSYMNAVRHGEKQE